MQTASLTCHPVTMTTPKTTSNLFHLWMFNLENPGHVSGFFFWNKRLREQFLRLSHWILGRGFPIAQKPAHF